jgi:mannose-6-phosphate isomerase-like protein (cupin superfamily)
MLVRQLNDCSEFTAGDGTILRELLHPDKHPIALRSSLAHAILPPGSSSRLHALATCEVYYILSGSGDMEIDGEIRAVGPGDCIVIPPNAKQRLHNRSTTEPIVFLCIVDPAWQPSDETVWHE